MKGTPLHDATVVGDTVGDPFKDTSSVAMNPIIKFATLFGLLAVELAITMKSDNGTPNNPLDDTTSPMRYVLAVIFFIIALIFVYRSFYSMRIGSGTSHESSTAPAGTSSVANPVYK